MNETMSSSETTILIADEQEGVQPKQKAEQNLPPSDNQPLEDSKRDETENVITPLRPYIEITQPDGISKSLAIGLHEESISGPLNPTPKPPIETDVNPQIDPSIVTQPDCAAKIVLESQQEEWTDTQLNSSTICQLVKSAHTEPEVEVQTSSFMPVCSDSSFSRNLEPCEKIFDSEIQNGKTHLEVSLQNEPDLQSTGDSDKDVATESKREDINEMKQRSPPQWPTSAHSEFLPEGAIGDPEKTSNDPISRIEGEDVTAKEFDQKETLLGAEDESVIRQANTTSATGTSNEEVVDFNELLKRMNEIDPSHKLRSLCKQGDVAALEEFLKSQVNLNAVSDEGWTSLHEIITHECQFTEIARVLMTHGASVNTQDLHGDSPLHSCLLYHCTKNIQLLLEHGANLNITNESGRKPIHVANDEDSLRLLLEHGADTNVADQLGNTSLHYAVVAKDRDRVRLLLTPKYKTDVGIKNSSGATPLHLATDPEIASLLLDASANPNETDLAGNSPLHLAVRGRHKEVVRNLIEKNANPNLANLSGKLPVSLAKDKEMKNILAGKSPVVTNGSSTSTTGTMALAAVAGGSSTPVMTSKKRTLSPCTLTPGNSSVAKESPGSILKKVRRVSNENGERTPRLRFSDVNQYTIVDDGIDRPERRVKVRPIYSEPQFSSDEDE